MKNLLFILLGVVSVIAISATTASIITIKPAQPKNILVKSFGHVTKANKYILEGYERGYILKDIYSDGSSRSVLVVMEKY